MVINTIIYASLRQKRERERGGNEYDLANHELSSISMKDNGCHVCVTNFRVVKILRYKSFVKKIEEIGNLNKFFKFIIVENDNSMEKKKIYAIIILL